MNNQIFSRDQLVFFIRALIRSISKQGPNDPRIWHYKHAETPCIDFIEGDINCTIHQIPDSDPDQTAAISYFSNEETVTPIEIELPRSQYQMVFAVLMANFDSRKNASDVICEILPY